MKLNDLALGVILLAFGLWVYVSASGFPALPGQPIGPGTFPKAIGTGFALAGLALCLAGLRRTAPLLTVAAGWREAARLRAAAVALFGTAILAAGFDWIGFPLGAGCLAAAIYLATGQGRLHWIALAFAFPLVVHLWMTKLLYVPLPAGLLKGFL